jgi:type I restriction enzyme S subunit
VIKHHIDKTMPIKLPDLPNGWRYASVSEVGASDEQAVMTGPFGTNLGRHDFKKRGIPLLTISCLTDQGIRLQKALFVSTEKANELKRYRLKSGDLLFSRMASVGRAGIVGPDLAGALFNYHIMRLRLDESKLLPKFFTAYVRGSKQVRDYLLAVNHGATRDGINTEQLLSMPVIVAPIDEQRLIVAEIEKQFTRLEAGIAALQRVQANLKRYRAAVLKAACEGRLVPTEAELARKEGRAYESADQLLARILNERRGKWTGRGRYKEPIVPDTTNFPSLLEGWAWASLDQLSWASSYGTSVKCSYEHSGSPVLRIPNIASGRIDLTDLKFSGAPESIDDGDELAPGDLLIIRTNGSKSLIGRSAVVREKLNRSTNYASYLIRFRLAREPALFAWIAAIWDCGFLRAWIEHRAATSAGQHNISMSVLSTLPLPLPPLAEQDRIVVEVERLLSVVDEQESVVLANLQRATRLRQSVLQRAFT